MSLGPSRHGHSSAAADWLKVMVITAGSFVMVTSEFLPVGMLTRIASDVHRTPGQLGLLVTAPGLTAAFAAPLSIFTLRRFDRRLVLIALTLLIALADLVVATAAGFAIILGGRILLGIAVGAFWSYAPDAARRLVSGQRGDIAMTIVLGGISLGTVVGVPIGAYLGDLIGWRLTFETAVAVAALVAVVQLLALPQIGAAIGKRALTLSPLLSVPSLRMGFLAITLVIAGHFAGYTYLEVFVRQSANLASSQLSWVLATYGLSGFAGTFAGERLTRLSGRFAFPVVATIMASSLAWCLTMPSSWTSLLPPVALWGAAYGGIPVCSRIWLYQAAPEESEIVSAFYVSIFQLSLAAGAFCGGRVFDQAGLQATLSFSAALAFAGGLLMLFTSLQLSRLNREIEVGI